MDAGPLTDPVGRRYTTPTVPSAQATDRRGGSAPRANVPGRVSRITPLTEDVTLLAVDAPRSFTFDGQYVDILNPERVTCCSRHDRRGRRGAGPVRRRAGALGRAGHEGRDAARGFVHEAVDRWLRASSTGSARRRQVYMAGPPAMSGATFAGLTENTASIAATSPATNRRLTAVAWGGGNPTAIACAEAEIRAPGSRGRSMNPTVPSLVERSHKRCAA